MTHLRAATLSVLLALSACAGAGGRMPPPQVETAAAPTRAEVIRASLPQNVRVFVVDKGKAVRAASGVAIGTGRANEGALSYVLTNAHVVQAKEGEQPSFMVLVDAPTGESHEFAARIVAQGEVPQADLAVLEIFGVALPAARLAPDAELAMGDDVFVVAAPYGRALSVSAGLLSQIDFATGTSERVPTMIKTDAAIGYGASGGGIYSSESGRLLGIIEGYRTAKVTVPGAESSYSFDVPMPGETFAAPSAKIRAFLEQHGLKRLVEQQQASFPAGNQAG